jgi:hypothetical protein
VNLVPKPSGAAAASELLTTLTSIGEQSLERERARGNPHRVIESAQRASSLSVIEHPVERRLGLHP